MLQDQAAKLFPSLICVTHPLTNSACVGSSYSREGQIRSEMIKATPEPFIQDCKGEREWEKLPKHQELSSHMCVKISSCAT